MRSAAPPASCSPPNRAVKDATCSSPHVLCNFDLPWNPMRIEQRVGRLSRIGQTRDIEILNLVTAGTVEESVLHLLQAKLNLFEFGDRRDRHDSRQPGGGTRVRGRGGRPVGRGGRHGRFPPAHGDTGRPPGAGQGEYLEQQAHDNKIFGDRFVPDP